MFAMLEKIPDFFGGSETPFRLLLAGEFPSLMPATTPNGLRRPELKPALPDRQPWQGGAISTG